jgi:hypothetical protein
MQQQVILHPNGIGDSKRPKIQEGELRPPNGYTNHVSTGHVTNSTNGIFHNPIVMIGSNATESQLLIETGTMFTEFR